MTLNVVHSFVSGIADDPTAAAAGEVLPSHWNANHTLSGGTDTCILFDKAGVIGEDTSLVWDYTNHLFTFGMPGGNQLVSGAPTKMQVLNPSNADFDFGTITYGGGVGGWSISASRGTGPGNHVATNSPDFLFFVGGNGDDGVSGFQTGCAFAGIAVGPFTPTSAPSDLQFYTCPTGSTVLRNNFNINRNGLATFCADPNSTHGAVWVYNISDAVAAPTNYERGVFDWTTTSNVLTIGTQKGGTGTARDMYLSPASGNVLHFMNASVGVNFGVGGANLVGSAANLAGIFVGGAGASSGSVISACDTSAQSVAGQIGVGNSIFGGGLTGFVGGAGTVVAWSGHVGNIISAPFDVAFGRSAASVIAIGDPASLTSGCGFQVYKTTDAFPGTPTNYERGVFDWTTTSNVLTIGTQAGGSGSVRGVQFISGGSGSWTFVSGANNNLFVGRNTAATGYNIISFNNVTVDTNNLGIVGGATGDPSLYFETTGSFTFGTSGNANYFYMDTARLGALLASVPSSGTFGFSSTSSASGTVDTGIARPAAHVVEINNGTAGTGPGVILPRPTTFANLPASPTQGMMASITDGLAGNCGDGSCTTFGTNVTGGTGALKLNLWYNGTHWTLIGK